MRAYVGARGDSINRIAATIRHISPNAPVNVMISKAEVRRLALALPDVSEDEGHFGFSVPSGLKRKGFAWAWRERIDPRKARVPNERVLAIRVANLDAKEILLMSDTDVFFTEPHYDGYSAVLVRLDVVTRAQLRGLLADAHAVTMRMKKSPRPAKRAAATKKSGGVTSRRRSRSITS
jgi:hypothetical protein